MGENTEISWTDHTFNPFWGCEKVSRGCDSCYAETFSKRTGHDIWGHDAPHRFFGEKHWNEPLKWDRLAEKEGHQAKVFCASMADVFQNADDIVGERWRLWKLIDATPNLIWQLLTKRPENVTRMVPLQWLTEWPENVWLGTSVEDQVRAGLRIPRLVGVKGVEVRFLSVEPLLERVELDLAGIGWCIVGGESGPGHRPFDADWARSIRDQCAEAGVAFFFKQHGGRTPKAGGNELDGRIYQEFPS